ncbi:MAG TPA: Crp/Fnr family transcriptional regulator [Bryobacteraceae bacterium]
MTNQDKVKSLQKTDLFGQIPADALDELAEKAVVRNIHQNEILFSAGESATGMFVVVAGTLRAFRQNPEGREQTIHVESEGATMAEVPVFDQGPYPSTVIGEENSTVLFLSKQHVRQFLLKHPEAALSALNILAKRLRHVAGLAEQLSLQDVTQRLASLLVEEAVRQKGELHDGVSFSMPLPHQRIAARLGSVREVVTRNLHKLMDEKVIAIRGHKIIVLDSRALQAKAGPGTE